jgi:hypothetical protein
LAVLSLILGVVLMCCASIPLTPDGQSLEGIWMKKDGTKSLSGNKEKPIKEARKEKKGPG